MPPSLQSEQGPISVYRFSQALSDALAEGDIIAPGSSGFAVEIFFLMLKAKAGQRVLHNRGTGSMGLSQPSAIGACIASGGRRTVSVDGDGGFQMNIQELATIASLNLPIKFFVINNQGYASIRASQKATFGRLVAADASSGVVLPDVCKVAEAYGVKSCRIIDPADVVPVVQRILAEPGPCVCEVMAALDEPREPRVANTQKSDGSIVSKPLEDLFPFLDREEFLANMIVPPLED
jgi:acetolactate synthase-1/2/3 large subunit